MSPSGPVVALGVRRRHAPRKKCIHALGAGLADERVGADSCAVEVHEGTRPEAEDGVLEAGEVGCLATSNPEPRAPSPQNPKAQTPKLRNAAGAIREPKKKTRGLEVIELGRLSIAFTMQTFSHCDLAIMPNCSAGVSRIKSMPYSARGKFLGTRKPLRAGAERVSLRYRWINFTGLVEI